VVIINTSAVVVMPASTFWAPSSRNERIPPWVTACRLMVCASVFLMVSCRVISSMMSSS
jgi:hypothetical protein